MVLDRTWNTQRQKVRQTGQYLLIAAALALGGGCKSTAEPTQAQQLQHQQMDWMDQQTGRSATQRDAPATVRSQRPQAEPAPFESGAKPDQATRPGETAGQAAQPTITPVTNITMDDPKNISHLGDARVRIVANIGTVPIYDREVREAVYQHAAELNHLGAAERRAKEKELYKQELHQLIERELILDELFSMLNHKKQESALKQLKEAAGKEAEGRLKDFRKRNSLPSEEALKEVLQMQGLTIAGLRRNFERSFMMSAYLGERVKPKLNCIGLAEIRDYYEEHPEEFQRSDSVKWQDLFVRVDKFRDKDEARRYAESLLNRAKHEEFTKLVDLDQGISKSNGGYGYGEKRGEIRPLELEDTIFAMNQGEVRLIDFGSGFHIIRIAERTLAGKRPFDEFVQNEIRKKLQNIVSKVEYRKVVETLWRKSQPQIHVE